MLQVMSYSTLPRHLPLHDVWYTNHPWPPILCQADESLSQDPKFQEKKVCWLSQFTPTAGPYLVN